MKAKKTNLKNAVMTATDNIRRFIKERKLQAVLLAYALLAPVSVVGAADAKWNAVIDFILPWITRLGGVVILIGAVEFGLAFKNDDAEGKTKGMRTVIAGCIVVAVGLSSSTFLY